MKRLFTLAVAAGILFFQSALKAQPVFEWATLLGDVQGLYPAPIATDANGNVYIAGQFSGQQDMDPGPGKHLLSNPVVTKFLLKLDANKNFLWVDTLPYYISAMRFDNAGNMYILGLDAPYGLHISKRDANYNLLWSVKVSSSATFPRGSEMSVDKSGNIYIGGFYSGYMDFDPGPAQVWMQASNYTAYVLKLNSHGQFKWVKDFRAPLSHVRGLGLDDTGNVFFAGLFTDSIDFDPGPGKVMGRRGPNGYAGYVAKLDSNGAYAWSKVLLDSDNASVSDLHVTKEGELVVAGVHTGSLDCDPGPGSYILQAGTAKNASYFVAKLTGNGDLVWARQQGHSSIRDGVLESHTAIDSNGNTYVAGFLGQASQMNFSTPAVTLSPLGAKDIFVSRINADGSFGWATSIGSPSGESIDGLDATPGGDVYVTGQFSDTVDFDPGASVYKLHGYTAPSVGGLSATFLLKLNQCAGPVAHNVVAACDSFDFGGFTHRLSGTYQRRFPTMACDSISIIDLQINADIQVSVTGYVLTANTSSGSCQWLDCDNGMSPIAGATGKTFSPVKTGRYAVEVSLAGCTDTSGCYYVIGTGVTDIPFAALTCHPNPTTGEITINFGERYNKVRAAITDITGRVLRNHIIEDTSIATITVDGPPGLYFINLSTGDGFETILKVVKQ